MSLRLLTFISKMEYKELVLPRNIKLENKLLQSALHINARSLLQKEDDIALLLDQFSFEFSTIMVTETWYYDKNSTLHLPGYQRYTYSTVLVDAAAELQYIRKESSTM